MSFINDMTMDEFSKFLILAIEKEKKDGIERQYLALLPSFVLTGKFMTFEAFYDKVTGANIDMRPADEILKESEKIQERFEHGT